MARRPAPTTITAGAGFGFEDIVGAFFAAYVLAGEAPFGREVGEATRLDFQTRPSGWLLDDLLVTFTSGHRLALSIKSNEQVTSGGVPDSFVRDIWEQYLQVESAVFDREADWLGLVTAPLPTDVRVALQWLEESARHQDEERFLAELRTPHASSELKRQLFASLRCPDDLATQQGIGDGHTVRLLSRIHFLQFDFRDALSRDKADSVRRCQLMLASGDLLEAHDLWEDTVRVVHKEREAGGHLTLPRFLAQRTSQHELKQSPQYREDVMATRRWTNTALERIPDRIGFKVRLPRSSELSNIDQACQRDAFVAITGTSGCGKSVLVKNWVSTLGDGVPVLWLDGNDLSQFGPLQLQQQLGLRHPLKEFASSLTSPVGYCVIDAAGSLSTGRDFANAAGLIRTLQVGEENSPWRLIMVAQLEEWTRVQQELNRTYGQVIDWNRVDIGLPGDDDIAVVVETFPQLAALIRQREIRPLLLRPKVLDLVAIRLASGDEVNTDQWVGESSVALWFWETEIEKRPVAIARSQAALRIAEVQAERLSAQIAVADAPPGTDYLLNDQIVTERRGLLSFQHDLYADWARLHVLLGQEDSIVQFVEERLTSPFWNRAVRLYGLYLLEQGGGTERWLQLVGKLGESSTGSLAQDLVLESVLFAANPLPLLESLWPALQTADGALLRRLLGRFLYVATEPNHNQLSLAQTSTEELRFATHERVPYWPYWLPVLSFLHAHKDQVIRLAPRLAAEVCLVWLTRTAEHWKGRLLAAAIAIDLAEHFLGREWQDRHGNKDVIETSFRAALAAVRELPVEVKSFALRASGRVIRPERPSPPPEHRPARRQTVPMYTLKKRRRRMKPWRHGPIQEPNPQFAAVCLAKAGLLPVVELAPDLAAEILLALKIEPPRKYDVNWSDPFTGRERAYEINDHGGEADHYPPFYWHYPWLRFLRSHPRQAIECIVTLVNFATERWVHYLRKTGGPSWITQLQIPSGRSRQWIGDEQSYFWSTTMWGNHAVCTALMALEFWLYQKLDAEQPIDEAIKWVAAEGRSVALLGVLASVACHHPQLLKGPLQFLLGAWSVLYIEQIKTVRFRPETAMIAWTGKSNDDRKYAWEWFTMPHRTKTLPEVARELFFTDEGIRTAFDGIRTNWEREQEELAAYGAREETEIVARFISMFTPAHYTATYSETHQGLLVTHQFPEELEEQGRTQRERAEGNLRLIGFPGRCRRILDGEERLDDESKVRGFWLEQEELTRLTQLADATPAVSAVDLACGVAAVLLVKHYDWLKTNPEKLVWCRECILNAVESPPISSSFDIDVSISNWLWHSFCAEALPSLWSADPSAARLRRCVMLVALDHHYKTIEILVRASFRLRKELGDDFQRLQSLIRHWALERPEVSRKEDEFFNDNFVLRPEERRTFREIYTGSTETSNRLLSDKFRSVIDAFVTGQLEPSLPPLFDKDDGQPAPWFNRPLEGERLRLRYGADVRIVRALYSYLPRFEDIDEGDAERRVWIEDWHELLNLVLHTLQPSTAEDCDKEVDGTPNEFDQWVLTSTSILIGWMTDVELPERFWQPILDLGWEAHPWVDAFLSGFLNYIAEEPGVDNPYYARIVQRWSSMITYADRSNTWNHRPGRHDWELHENWKSLMGCGGFMPLPWPGTYKPILEGVADHLAEYCGRRITGDDSLGVFIQLLRRPAATQLQIRALAWLEPHFIKEADAAESESRAHRQLSHLLGELWQEQREPLRQDRVAFACYRRLVKILVDRQDTIALEIQNRIITT